MLGDTIDIERDTRRYDQLIREGMLPAGAIRKIEAEKRLGIGVVNSDESIDVVKVAIIGLGLLIGISVIKRIISPGTVSGVGSGVGSGIESGILLDNIEGIDLNALYECRQKGLMS